VEIETFYFVYWLEIIIVIEEIRNISIFFVNTWLPLVAWTDQVQAYIKLLHLWLQIKRLYYLKTKCTFVAYILKNYSIEFDENLGDCF